MMSKGAKYIILNDPFQQKIYTCKEARKYGPYGKKKKKKNQSSETILKGSPETELIR